MSVVSQPPPHPEIVSNVVNHLENLSDRHLLRRHHRIRATAMLSGVVLAEALLFVVVSRLSGGYLLDRSVAVTLVASAAGGGMAWLAKNRVRLDRLPSDRAALAACGPELLPALLWLDRRWSDRLQEVCLEPGTDIAVVEVADGLADSHPGTVAELIADATSLVSPPPGQ